MCPPRPMEILIVARDPAPARALELAFAMLGHAVCVDHDGAAALARSAERTRAWPLAIVGSVEDLAAAELFAALRALPGGANALLLALCERTASDAIVAALDAGADGYLGLPLEAGQLRERLALAERRQQERPATPAIVTTVVQPDAFGEVLVDRGRGLRVLVDPRGGIHWVDLEATILLGQPRERLLGGNLLPLIHPDDQPAAMRLIAAAANRSSEEPAADLRLLGADGGWRVFDVRALDVPEDPAGQILLDAYDISHRKRREELAQRQAVFDPQTGLPSRAAFNLYLSHALARADRRGESVVMMFMDLDDLGRVNERHGRSAGDLVVQAVAARLRASLRATDTAARVGDDEFMILLEDIASDAEAGAIAERVVREVGAPFELAGYPPIDVSASVGVALSHPGARRANGDLGADGESQLDVLLRRADMALSRAKSSGKGRWELFDLRAASGGITAPPVRYPLDV